MTDKPRPPPLPPRPIVPEPFVDLTETPEPQSTRMRSTPPSGSLLLRREVERLSEDPKDAEIRDLRMTNVLYRERLAAVQASMPNTAPSAAPAPLTLRTMTKRELAKVGGKWATVIAVAALALPVIAKRWPAYADLVAFVQSLLP